MKFNSYLIHIYLLYYIIFLIIYLFNDDKHIYFVIFKEWKQFQNRLPPFLFLQLGFHHLRFLRQIKH